MLLMLLLLAATLLHAAARGENLLLAPEVTRRNPVIDRDFPDPCILRQGNEFFAYATNSAGDNVQLARSTDLIHWKKLPDALPVLPAWARRGWTWAPEVLQLPYEREFTLYFTARDRRSGRQCIGMAKAAAPEGPFSSNATAALVAQVDLGGSIDPFVFVDEDKTPWLLWKNDGNAIGQSTWIFIQQLADGGASLLGEPRRILTADQAWEGRLVEAPTLVKQGGRYMLFYSANAYACERYAIGYAVADSISGPYLKPQNTPWMQSRKGVCGPGGQCILETAAGESWLAYHSWDAHMRYRAMHLEPLEWIDQRPVVAMESSTHKPRVQPKVLDIQR